MINDRYLVLDKNHQLAFLSVGLCVLAIFEFQQLNYFKAQLITCNDAAGISVPTDVRATIVTHHSIQITWESSSSSNFTGYLISYTTTASYTSGGSVTVDGGSTTSGTLTNLEEDTPYTITVQATTSDNRMSANSNEVSVRTYTDGK